jgi:hypothetical protein
VWETTARQISGGEQDPLLVFYLKKNRMARCHAPFDKKNVASCIADVPFFISSNDP